VIKQEAVAWTLFSPADGDAFHDESGAERPLTSNSSFAPMHHPKHSPRGVRGAEPFVDFQMPAAPAAAPLAAASAGGGAGAPAESDQARKEKLLRLQQQHTKHLLKLNESLRVKASNQKAALGKRLEERRRRSQAADGGSGGAANSEELKAQFEETQRENAMLQTQLMDATAAQCSMLTQLQAIERNVGSPRAAKGDEVRASLEASQLNSEARNAAAGAAGFASPPKEPHPPPTGSPQLSPADLSPTAARGSGETTAPADDDACGDSFELDEKFQTLKDKLNAMSLSGMMGTMDDGVGGSAGAAAALDGDDGDILNSSMEARNKAKAKTADLLSEHQEGLDRLEHSWENKVIKHRSKLELRVALQKKRFEEALTTEKLEEDFMANIDAMFEMPPSPAGSDAGKANGFKAETASPLVRLGEENDHLRGKLTQMERARDVLAKRLATTLALHGLSQADFGADDDLGSEFGSDALSLRAATL